jgi:hypothetical protein
VACQLRGSCLESKTTEPAHAGRLPLEPDGGGQSQCCMWHATAESAVPQGRVTCTRLRKQAMAATRTSAHGLDNALNMQGSVKYEVEPVARTPS